MAGQFAKDVLGVFERGAKLMRYVWRRMLRTHATPHEIALGCAAGVFAAFTPFLGLQMALAIAVAYALRVNVAAAIAGTFVGNPLSWPAIWGVSYVTGSWILAQNAASASELFEQGAHAVSETINAQSGAVIDTAVVNFKPIVHPLTVGGLLIGLIVAAASYYPTYQAVRMYQKRRHP